MKKRPMHEFRVVFSLLKESPNSAYKIRNRFGYGKHNDYKKACESLAKKGVLDRLNIKKRKRIYGSKLKLTPITHENCDYRINYEGLAKEIFEELRKRSKKILSQEDFEITFKFLKTKYFREIFGEWGDENNLYPKMRSLNVLFLYQGFYDMSRVDEATKKYPKEKSIILKMHEMYRKIMEMPEKFFQN